MHDHMQCECVYNYTFTRTIRYCTLQSVCALYSAYSYRSRKVANIAARYHAFSVTEVLFKLDACPSYISVKTVKTRAL